MNFVVYLVLLGQYCLLYVGGVVSFDEQKVEARRGLFRGIVLFQGSVASVSLVYYCASNSDFESIQKYCQTTTLQGLSPSVSLFMLLDQCG